MRSRRGAAGPLGVFGVLAAGLLMALVGAACVAPAEAQEIRLRGLSGGELTESDLQRGSVIVVVWASWPPRSRDVVAKVNDIDSRWGSRARVVTVNYQESREEIEGFLAGKGLRAPVYLDSEGEFSKKYSKPNLPVLLVFRDGREAVKEALPDDPHPTISRALE